jgi:LysR family transcriptional activator of mexEF-oprN operon
MEAWLLAPLMRALEPLAPELRLISVPVQFRSVQEALELRRVDMAVTVADELPASVLREPLLRDQGFVCVFDPAHVPAAKRMSERAYFERDHVIVSYNGDLRGVVEDALQKQRRVRCAVGSFSHLGDLVQGTALVATVPRLVARHILRLHPQLMAAELPFALPGGALELLWPSATDDDDACKFVREQLRAVVRSLSA